MKSYNGFIRFVFKIDCETKEILDTWETNVFIPGLSYPKKEAGKYTKTIEEWISEDIVDETDQLTKFITDNFDFGSKGDKWIEFYGKLTYRIDGDSYEVDTEFETYDEDWQEIDGEFFEEFANENLERW